MTKLELGDNLVHLLQLLILATACVLLAIFTTLDKTVLVALFFGSGGILSTIHLMNINASNASTSTALPPATALPVPLVPTVPALPVSTLSVSVPGLEETQPRMSVAPSAS